MQPGTVLPLVSSPARSQSSRIHLKVLLQSKIAQATQPGPFGAACCAYTVTSTAFSSLLLHGMSLAQTYTAIGRPSTHENTTKSTDAPTDTTTPSNPFDMPSSLSRHMTAMLMSPSTLFPSMQPRSPMAGASFILPRPFTHTRPSLSPILSVTTSTSFLITTQCSSNA